MKHRILTRCCAESLRTCKTADDHLAATYMCVIRPTAQLEISVHCTGDHHGVVQNGDGSAFEFLFDKPVYWKGLTFRGTIVIGENYINAETTDQGLS